MAFDGAGNFVRLYNWTDDKNNAIRITSVRHDNEDDGFATAFNQTFLRTGVAPMSGDIQMGNNGIKGVEAGTVDAPAFSFNGDPGSGLYYPSAGVMAVSIGGVKRGEWNSLGLCVTDGFFGVNTTTPRTALDVIGNTSLEGILEKTIAAATALTGVIALKFNDGVQYIYTANAIANFSFNFVGETGVDLDDVMADNQTVTFAIEVPQGAAAYYCTTITIDGVAPAQLKWYGGAPTQGNINSIDVYAVTVHKRSAGVFWVRASQSQVL